MDNDGTTTGSDGVTRATGDRRPSPAANLRAARSLIAIEDNWTQFDRGSIDSGPRCALGAIDAAIGYFEWGDASREEVRLLADAIRRVGFTDDRNSFGDRSGDSWLVANFNDRRTHAEVLAAFDSAIEAAMKDR